MVKIKCLLLVLLIALLNSLCSGKEYQHRWVYVSRSLNADSDVRDIRDIIKTASEHGLNGMVLSAGLDRLDRKGPAYFKRLEQVKQVCKEYNIEIIPIIFSVGYGGAVLAHDKNLAAGVAVKDALFVVKDGNARLVSDFPVKIENSDFEEGYLNRLRGYRFHDKPGAVSFMDREVFRSGKASLRFENFGKYRHGHARAMQEVSVKPHRCYKVRCSVKTEHLAPASFRILVLGEDGRDLALWNSRVPASTDWQEIVMGFNSLDYDKVRVYVGVWGGKSGRFWVDDLKIEEVGLLNVLRRPGTPVTVKNEQTGSIYEEGRDFAELKDPKLDFKFDHEPPVIRILPNSRIKDGDRLRVSYYHGMSIRSGQVTVCMSEPKLYDIWAKQAQLIHRHLAPSKYFLSMDEIRAGGTCEACKKRSMTIAQILGDCISRQVKIIRSVNQDADVFIWSDMLDPNHNAHGKYYLVDGDFTDAWKYIPKDIVIVCWYHKKRQQSLKFFSSRGFQTVAGAYYDGDNLDNPKGWLEVLYRTPKACGIMYTTWRNKYDLLGDFGDLVSGRIGSKQ